MKLKKSQSGRSMVEMLGVLAIIGVLSVGGIAGYSLSMRRHRANGVVDLASKYALVLYGQCQQLILEGHSEKCEDLVTFENAGIGALPSGVRSFGSAIVDEDTVSIHINFTDQKLCQATAPILGVGCYGATDTGYFFTAEIKQN